MPGTILGAIPTIRFFERPARSANLICKPGNRTYAMRTRGEHVHKCSARGRVLDADSGGEEAHWVEGCDQCGGCELEDSPQTFLSLGLIVLASTCNEEGRACDE